MLYLGKGRGEMRAILGGKFRHVCGSEPWKWAEPAEMYPLVIGTCVQVLKQDLHKRTSAGSQLRSLSARRGLGYVYYCYATLPGPAASLSPWGCSWTSRGLKITPPLREAGRKSEVGTGQELLGSILVLFHSCPQ